MKLQFRKSISWSKISSSYPSFKIKYEGTMFDVAGLSLFPNANTDFNLLLAFCNSIIARECLKFLSPTLNYETGHISNLPFDNRIYKKDIDLLTSDSVSISHFDWDSYETSWDFKKHPLV